MSRLIVLGWHNIEPTPFFRGRSAASAHRSFLRQARLLRRFANVVPLRSALDDLASGRPLPPRAVALTFDDGYRDHATLAGPALQALGLPATFFLVTDILSGDRAGWWEDLGWEFEQATAVDLSWAERRYDLRDPRVRRTAAREIAQSLKMMDSGQRADAIDELRGRLAPASAMPARQFLDWDEAAALLKQGHDIGSHTCTHPILSREQSDQQGRELSDSRRLLTAHFDRTIDLLAYPNGREQDYDHDTLRIAQGAGYDFAVTTRKGLARAGTAPYEVPRVMMSADMNVLDVLAGAGRLARRRLLPS